MCLSLRQRKAGSLKRNGSEAIAESLALVDFKWSRDTKFRTMKGDSTIKKKGTRYARMLSERAGFKKENCFRR